MLYKVQERKDRLMKKIGHMLEGKSQHVVELLGYYWHVIMAAEANIRPGTDSVEQKEVKNVIDKNRYQRCLCLFIFLKTFPQTEICSCTECEL